MFPFKFNLYCYNTARLNQQKLEKFLHALNDGKIGKKAFHMRLAKEEDSERLTGYAHGGVTPVGLATECMPVIISDKIVGLDPGVFWLGGGEPDLKMSFRADAFTAATDAFVVDCTY
jgi:prolyl-tRNA editing enzyme YbaK/EbsC (Cys-tRNA(Pro) deacylase)